MLSQTLAWLEVWQVVLILIRNVVTSQRVPGLPCSTSLTRIDSRYFLCFRRFHPLLKTGPLDSVVMTRVGCSSPQRPIHAV